jgi:hypothetical protein
MRSILTAGPVSFDIDGIERIRITTTKARVVRIVNGSYSIGS